MQDTSPQETAPELVPSKALELFHAARAYEAALARLLVAGLAERGITVSTGQLGFLAALVCGENTASDVARALGISRQAAQKQIADLVSAGVLQITTDPARRNRKVVTFTAQGVALMAESRQILATLDDRLAGAGDVAEAQRVLSADLG